MIKATYQWARQDGASITVKVDAVEDCTDGFPSWAEWMVHLKRSDQRTPSWESPSATTGVIEARPQKNNLWLVALARKTAIRKWQTESWNDRNFGGVGFGFNLQATITLMPTRRLDLQRKKTEITDWPKIVSGRNGLMCQELPPELRYVYGGDPIKLDSNVEGGRKANNIIWIYFVMLMYQIYFRL